MATTTLILKEPKSESETLIYLVLRFLNTRIKYSTGQKIHPKFWNTAKQCAKETRQFPSYSELNTLLKRYESAAQDVYRKLLNDGTEITADNLKNALDEIFKINLKPQKNLTFLGFIENYIETCNKKQGTTKTYKQALRILKAYQDNTKNQLTFESIDLDFYESFTKFLVQSGYHENTIGSFIKNVKVFMNEALERGLTSNVSFKSRKFKSLNEETENIYLNKEEISRLYKLDLKKDKTLSDVRDLFIIGCYTGLRFSDLSKLTDKHIIDKGTKLKIQTEKTGELVIIPLHKYVREILERNKGKFPNVISNQKTNDYLKKIGADAKIEEEVIIHYTKGGKRTSETFKKYDLITTHTARRSFATNAYLEDIPTISIMKITGHRTERAFLKYIKISQEDNANKLINHPFFK